MLKLPIFVFSFNLSMTVRFRLVTLSESVQDTVSPFLVVLSSRRERSNFPHRFVRHSIFCPHHSAFLASLRAKSSGGCERRHAAFSERAGVDWSDTLTPVDPAFDRGRRTQEAGLRADRHCVLFSPPARKKQKRASVGDASLAACTRCA